MKRRKQSKQSTTVVNGGNTPTGINKWAISLLRYSAAFLDWTGAELKQMNRRARKLMTMLNPILGLKRYVLTSEEGLLITARRVDGDYEQQEFKERRRNERSNVLKEKKLHGQFFNKFEEVAGEEKWLWLRDRSIKRETESLIMAAKRIKEKIEKTQAESVDCVEKWMRQ